MNEMIIELLAFVAAFCYTLSGVFAAKGMKNSNPISATIVSMIMNNVLLWPFAYTNTFLKFDTSAIIFFAFSSLLAPTAGRMLNFLAIEKVGVSVSGPILGSQPLFVVLLAVFFLNEKLLPLAYVGIVMTVVGIVIITLSRGKDGGSTGVFQRRSVVFPLLAALCFASSGVFRKMGLNIQNDPILAAAETSFFGLLFFLILLLGAGKIKQISVNKRSAFFFILAGLSTSIAWVFNFQALSLGAVSIVTAILSTQPLISLLLSYLFLRKVEQVTFQKMLGAALVVLGISLVTMIS
jgi:uncharacterized membrane protein